MFNKIDPIILKIDSFHVHNRIYGIARSIIAFSLLLTLLFNSAEILFPNPPGYRDFLLVGISRISIFYLMSSHLIFAKWISILILLMVVIGWRPRWTGIAHWWVAFSFFSSCPIIDGGDQIGAILSFLIIPFTLSDKRKWHWTSIDMPASFYVKGLNYLFYLCIRLQASVIYFFAAAEKIAVPEWKNGTVIYYWLNHSTFGMNDNFKFIVEPIIESPAVAIITWSVLALEVLLAMALVAPKNIRTQLLPIGISFHFLIWLFHGLFSFFFYMTAILLLYLISLDQPLKYGRKWNLSKLATYLTS